MDILLWAIISIIAILFLTILSGTVVSYISNGSSSTNGFMRDFHIGAAAVNTFVVGGLLWLFCKISLGTVLLLPLLVVLTWSASRIFIKSSQQTHIWDRTAVGRIALCLLISALATYVIGPMLGITPGMGPLFMGLIYAACWALLFSI